MRLNSGLEVNVFDGKGNEYAGRIKNIDRSSVYIEIIKSVEPIKQDTCNITLYQALPKKGKIDLIIEKTAELGVSRIVPMITERTIPVIKTERVSKIDRWERLARSAAKQCGRATLPVIDSVRRFEECLADSKSSDLVVFAALDKDVRPLKKILETSRPASISVFVGPEGDFSPNEIGKAKEQGYIMCSLGPLVLRVETAAIYILSCLNYEFAR
jgi:16S rRNA (uracil1498-N3)-methyltransferase